MTRSTTSKRRRPRRPQSRTRRLVCESLESRDLLATLVGGEFVVNHTTLGDQFNASAAIDSTGELVVAFNSFGQDGDENGVFVRRFSAAGPAREAADLAVNTTTAGNQLFPDIDMAADGRFVVVWESEGQDGDGSGVYGRRFQADGTPAGDEFQVNTTTAGGQFFANVAVADDGSFVVVWDSLGPAAASRGIFGQRFASDGSPQGNEFRINQTLDGGQFFPDVAGNADGEFVVAWEQQDATTNQVTVLSRHFDAQGNALTDEVTVLATAGDQQFPAVAIDDAGSFTVAWAEANASGQNVLSRSFSANGQPLADAITHTTETLGQMVVPTVAENGKGDLIVAWNQQLAAGTNQDIAARIIRASGAVEAELIVNATTDNEQRFPTTAISNSGQIAVAWNSFGQDGSNEGIVGQRILLNQSVVVDLNGPNEDGNSFATNFESGSPAVSIVAPDMLLEDPDGPAVNSVRIKLLNAPDGASEQLSVELGGTSISGDYDPQTGELLLTGPDTASAFQEVLRTLRYQNSQTATPGDRTVQITVDDSLSESAAVESVITVTAAPMNGSIGGHVFVDSNDNGVRDAHETGLPNVPVHISGPVTVTVVTSADGTYRFNELPAGTYSLWQTQPGAFLDGKDIVGDPSASMSNDRFDGIELEAGEDVRGFHFGERSLRPELISKQFYLASTPDLATVLTEMSLNADFGWHQLGAGPGGNFAISTQSAATTAFEIYDSNFMPAVITTTGAETVLEMAEGESYFIHLPEASENVHVTLERMLDPSLRDNQYHRFDVNNDGRLSPLDALQIINALNAPDRPLPSGLFLDVSRDGTLSSLDVLLLFNKLNRVHADYLLERAEIAQRMEAAALEAEAAPEKSIIKSSIQHLLPQFEQAHDAQHDELAAQLRRRIMPADELFQRGDDDWRWDIEALIDRIVE